MEDPLKYFSRLVVESSLYKKKWWWMLEFGTVSWHSTLYSLLLVYWIKAQRFVGFHFPLVSLRGSVTFKTWHLLSSPRVRRYLQTKSQRENTCRKTFVLQTEQKCLYCRFQTEKSAKYLNIAKFTCCNWSILRIFSSLSSELKQL